MLGLLTALALAGMNVSDATVDAAYTASYSDCMSHGEAGKGVTPAMRNCLSQEYLRQDGRLNRAYGAALARRKPAAQAALRRSERAWLVERDRFCATEGAGDGGTLGQLELAQCNLRETTRRAVWLSRLR